MSYIEDTNPRELMKLLAEIHDRDTVLPDFQRDFVWMPRATMELIVSIACDYPAGSILRMRDPDSSFANREFEGAPEIGGHKHTYLVLDGQQRLTSLYQAFYAAGKHRYFLNLRQLLDGEDFENAVFYDGVKGRYSCKYENFDEQAKDLILPLSRLKDGDGYTQWAVEYDKWRRTGQQSLLPGDGSGVKFPELAGLLDKEFCGWNQVISGYKFPVVTLGGETPIEAVCTIFETLNRTGVKLGVFDLLTARFRKYGINLRDWRREMFARHPIIRDFEVDPGYVLQGVSLASRKEAGLAPSSKRRDVLNLTQNSIEKWWCKTVAGLAKGLTILRDDCGVMSAKQVPYETMFPALAAVLAFVGSDNTAADGARREKIKRWFWCSVFSQAYEGSAVTQAIKDTVELLRWFDGGDEPDTVKKFNFDPNTLRETTVKQRAVYRGAICLMLTRTPKDFYDGAVITAAIMDEKKVEAHHVFPKNYLRKAQPGVDAFWRDCVLNMALIRHETNRKISDRAPSVYLAEMREYARKAGDSFNIDKVLESHLCPPGEESALSRDNFGEFLQYRQERLCEAIRRATGLSESGGDSE